MRSFDEGHTDARDALPLVERLPRCLVRCTATRGSAEVRSLTAVALALSRSSRRTDALGQALLTKGGSMRFRRWIIVSAAALGIAACCPRRRACGAAEHQLVGRHQELLGRL